ncbi:MAG: 23S rRNA (adenine(2503)-C(2))-methyltransferase RlmN, partial [Candidatus Cloacimonetes bacterium]|nr:23S rRNA (adenine(2503)-C(2))-methyltransferase RlmN [Candidatus Cloacimonadota bacterium]
MNHILGLLPAEISKYFAENKIAKYRVSQLFEWLYDKMEINHQKMSSLPENLRQKLTEKFAFNLPQFKIFVSQDGTQKILLELFDGNKIEMVLIPNGDKNTLCISSQVGCARDCQFCATAKLGLKRNLEVHEIISQIYLAKQILAEKKLTNIVFMGMGEPLDNYENVLKSLKILQNESCFNFSPRKITISTAGVIPQIAKLAESRVKVKLAVSLNSAIQEKREKLMPISKRYPLSELKKTLQDFRKNTAYRITFEYVMLKNFNIDEKDVKALRKFLGDMSCKLNVIKWNAVDNLPYETPSEKEIEKFINDVKHHNYAVMYRRSRGDDIAAACGQLAVNNEETLTQKDAESYDKERGTN